MAYTTINKGSDYFNTVLWSGNSSTQAITGVGFQPDFNWIKVRTDIDNHILTDSVRPSLAVLNSDRTNAEQGAKLSSLDSDGFTCTSDSTVNGTGQTYVGWNWLASNTTASNTQGSIASTVSVNTTSGFSIVSYTGTGANATIGHGLGVAPKMIIIKNRNSVTNWLVYHASLGNGNSIVLNTTGASFSAGDWQNTTPTSSIIYLSGGPAVNESSSNHIAYCFADVKGFSKFGKYDGNAGVGAFVNNFQYLGFKPAFVIIKCYNAAESWNVFDNKRNGYNYQNNYLIPNDTNAEVSAPNQGIDLLSNGFNPYYGTGTINRSGKSYIYMAFAENPFVGSDGTPTTAR